MAAVGNTSFKPETSLSVSTVEAAPLRRAVASSPRESHSSDGEAEEGDRWVSAPSG
jgi:hypothetical protein